MKIKELAAKAIFQCNKHSPTLLTVGAVAGIGATVCLTHRAAVKSTLEIMDDPSAPETFQQRARLVWRNYIPPAITGAATAGAMVGANRISLKRLGAAHAGLVIAERTYEEYREKIKETFGERADTNARESIAKDRVKNTEPPSQEILVTGPGNVLSMELYTGRYFACDMERLRRAQNDLNARLISQDYASLEDFYDMIGLQPTSYSGEIGWNSDRLMELEFSPVMTEDGRPCLAFEYNYTRPLYEG